MSRYLTPIARDRVVENMSDGVIVLDMHAHIVDMNPAAQQMMRCSLEEVLGQPLERFLRRWPGLAERFREVLEAHTEIILGEEEAPRYYDLHISPLYDRRETLIGRLIVLHDITEYKKLEAEQERYAAQNARFFQEEQRQRKIAEGLRQAMLVLSRSLDYNEIVTEILAQIRRLIPYDSAGFFLKDGDDLRLSNGMGFDYDVVDNRIPLDSRNRTVQAFKHRRTEVIPDVCVDPHWHPFSTHEKVHSAVAAPLVIGEEVIGVLTVDRVEPQAFTDEDVKILQVFANQAAIAFKNAQLHRQAQTVAALDERNRLAQELHDAVNQTLFSAALIAEALPDIWAEDPQHGEEVLEELRLLTQGALAEMRTLLLELRPAALAERNFGELLQHLTKAFANRTRIPVNLVIASDCTLPSEVQIVFYRIAQEALVNIAKHAKATQVSLKFDCTSAEAVLSISDNGCGFDINCVLVGHFGVTIMHERAEGIGAALDIDSQPGRGVYITLRWKDGGTSDA
jgi:two-component system nitrate/nitrite sensor histidine kinase NarX